MAKKKKPTDSHDTNWYGWTQIDKWMNVETMVTEQGERILKKKKEEIMKGKILFQLFH